MDLLNQRWWSWGTPSHIVVPLMSEEFEAWCENTYTVRPSPSTQWEVGIDDFDYHTRRQLSEGSSSRYLSTQKWLWEE